MLWSKEFFFMTDEDKEKKAFRNYWVGFGCYVLKWISTEGIIRWVTVHILNFSLAVFPCLGGKHNIFMAFTDIIRFHKRQCISLGWVSGGFVWYIKVKQMVKLVKSTQSSYESNLLVFSE